MRDRAASQAYLFIERLFRHSASKVRLYIRCYEKFISNSAAVEILTQTDMQLLIANDTPDELIDLVIEARKENPDLTKNQVKQLIKGFEQAREQLVEKDTRLEVVTTELSNTVGQLDETQLELKRVIEERDAVKQDAARARESAERTLVEMSSVSQSMSTLNMELANRERDIKDLHRKLAEAQAAVRTETKEVPTIPGEFETMEAAIEDQITRSREAGRKMEEVQQQLAALEGQLAEQRAAAEAGEVLEKKVSTLIDRFGQYAQEYHTAQLLVTADGSPQRFTKLFQALADLIGKHHSEVLAAAHAS
ncbi:MAG: hypothetical protein KGQ57_00145 [Burkholderiales bacterium]|nr:hypothetical protein [Burkholderiales bacterium]